MSALGESIGQKWITSIKTAVGCQHRAFRVRQGDQRIGLGSQTFRGQIEHERFAWLCFEFQPIGVARPLERSPKTYWKIPDGQKGESVRWIFVNLSQVIHEEFDFAAFPILVRDRNLIAPSLQVYRGSKLDPDLIRAVRHGQQEFTFYFWVLHF